MAWIEFHTPLRDHWKVQRLADLMKVEYAQALGHLACLWCWVAENSPKGGLKHFTAKELCTAARINADLDLKSLLKQVKLLDANDRIHDWGKHGLKLLESKRKRQKEYRSRLCQRDVTVSPTNHTNQPTIPNQPKDNPASPLPVNPYKVDLKQISVCGLDEMAKHKIYNQVVNVFKVRGWDTETLPLKAFRTVAESVTKANPRETFPYFMRSLERHCNENSEAYTAQSRIESKKPKVSKSVAEIMSKIVVAA